jgi:hypothetical protein
MMRMKPVAAGIALLVTLAGCAGPSIQGQGAIDGPGIAQSTLTAGPIRAGAVQQRNYWDTYDFERDKS